MTARLGCQLDPEAEGDLGRLGGPELVDHRGGPGDDGEISNKGRSGLHRLSTGQRSLVQPIPCAFEESQNPLFSGPAACQQTVAVKVYVASQQRFLRLEQLSSLRKRVEPGPDWGQ